MSHIRYHYLVMFILYLISVLLIRKSHEDAGYFTVTKYINEIFLVLVKIALLPRHVALKIMYPCSMD